jgi:hypothetical protein
MVTFIPSLDDDVSTEEVLWPQVSLLKPRFDPRDVHVGFMENKMA